VIAITFALPAESSGLVALACKKKTAACGDGRIIHGTIEQRDVAIFHTGVGRETCARKIDNFLRTERPRFLLSSGFAGGVAENLQVGDIILADNFSDPGLLAQAQQLLGDRARVGKLFTSTAIADSIDERNQIARAHDAAAVDMETEVIAQACAAHGIPLLSLRVISDTARAPFPAPPHILFDIERQGTNVAKLTSYLLTNPIQVLGLIRFARQIARARRALNSAITSVLRKF
jgi:adenosylhomocysteine nucleosidase